MKANTARLSRAQRTGEEGFTLIEVMIAILVLLIGLGAVMQLVPAAIQSNLYNRADSTSTVIAQRQLSMMADQPLTANTYTDPDDGNVYQLGGPGAGGFGSPVIIMAGGMTRINFTAAPVPGYQKIYADPNSTSRANYDIRWRVLVNTTGAAGEVAAKRFIVGVQRRGLTSPIPAATVDSGVYR